MLRRFSTDRPISASGFFVSCC